MTTPEVVQAISVRDQRVFVGTGSCIPDPASPGVAKPTGGVSSVSIDGGEPASLWNDSEAVMAIATWNDNVFMLTDRQCMAGHQVSLHRVPAVGGAGERIAEWGGGLFCAKLLSTDDALYWLIPGTVHRYDGRSDTVIASRYTCNGDMAVSAGRIVWAAASSLYGVPAVGGSMSELWHGAQNVYYMTGDPLGRGFYAATESQLFVVGTGGQTLAVLDGQTRIGPLVADDHYVYWSDPPNRQISKRAWQGGEPTVVVSDVVTGALAQTATDIVWAEYDRGRRMSSVKRISKTTP